GLELLNVVSPSQSPETLGHVARRLVPARAVGRTGRLDLLQALLARQPLSSVETDHVVVGAAAFGHMHVLDHLSESNNTELPIGKIFSAAVGGAQLPVMDWCVRHGLEFPDGPEFCQGPCPILLATRHCHIVVLEWIKAYALEHNVEFPSLEFNLSCRFCDPSSARRVAVLDWWKAEYAAAARQEAPSIFDLAELPAPLIDQASNGIMMLDWWRDHCAEQGRPFKWPALDPYFLSLIVKQGNVHVWLRWWTEAASGDSSWALANSLPLMCAHGTTHLLDWYWHFTHDPASNVTFPADWRPRRPFRNLETIQWWEAKVATGEVDAAIFTLETSDGNSPLEKLLALPVSDWPDSKVLNWWWSRPEIIGAAVNISDAHLLEVMRNHKFDLLHWYLCHNADESKLPTLSLTNMASLVASGYANFLEALWAKATPHHRDRVFTFITSKIDVRYILGYLPLPTVLSFLWRFFVEHDLPLDRLFRADSVLIALDNGYLDAAR
ncbi:hypothetical protein BC828DRAFT_410024, partial [Blastocladiella britannica]